MNFNKRIIECYDKTADEYSKKFSNEFSHKPFDRMILKNFADENKRNTPAADIGCGPGQTTRFLFDAGLKNITGIDISTEMIRKACSLNKGIKFETGNMFDLKYDDGHFGSVIAFYAIVNFTYSQIGKIFKEIGRVLKGGGQFLFSFHVGNKKVHIEKFLEKNVNIDFYFFKTDKTITLLEMSGFKIITAAERYPYPDIEYPSRRAYILCSKSPNES